MFTETYVVTQAPQFEGQHFLHRCDCQVLPDEMELAKIGTFDSCEPAFAKAQERFSPLEACAFCCSACHNEAE